MELFPVEYSSLSTKALLKLAIDAYTLPHDCEIQFLKRGFNDTYLLSNQNIKYILRVYKHNWRSKKSIENEIQLLVYLSKNGIHVSVPIADKNENYIHSLNAPEGMRHAVLFSFAEGEQVRKQTTEQSFLLGAETGKIHALTKNKTFSECAFNYDIAIQFKDITTTLSPILSKHKEQLNYLFKLKEEFISAFSNVTISEIATGICHGDLQAENLHLQNDKITFFDFDFFGNGALIYDIGVFMWYDQKNKTPEIIKAFLDGYQTQRKLSPTELKMLPYFSTLRALFQMTLFCKISNGKQLPLWPTQQVANFIGKVEQWHTKAVSKSNY